MAVHIQNEKSVSSPGEGILFISKNYEKVSCWDLYFCLEHISVQECTDKNIMCK